MTMATTTAATAEGNSHPPDYDDEDDDVDEDQIRILREQFHVFDVDGDGYIGTEELRQGLKRLGEKVSRSDFKRMIRSIKGDDDDGEDLRMTFEQFICWNQSLFVFNMQDLFQEIDTDESGWLSKDEIRQYYEKTARKYTDEEINQFIQQVDFNDDGQMQMDEFISAMAAERKGHAYFITNGEMYLAKLKAEFDAIDANGDGYLTREELYQGNAEQGEYALSAEELEEMMAELKELDTDGDGQISLQEFIAATVAIKEEKSKKLQEKVETKRKKKKSKKEDGSKKKKSSSSKRPLN